MFENFIMILRIKKTAAAIIKLFKGKKITKDNFYDPLKIDECCYPVRKKMSNGWDLPPSEPSGLSYEEYKKKMIEVQPMSNPIEDLRYLQYRYDSNELFTKPDSMYPISCGRTTIEKCTECNHAAVIENKCYDCYLKSETQNK